LAFCSDGIIKSGNLMKTFALRLAVFSGLGILLAQTCPATSLVLTGFTNQTVTYGSPASLRVSVAGSTPLTYQWQFNGTNLSKNVFATVAGNGSAGFAADGSNAITASLSGPTGLAVGPDGLLYFVDNNRIRKINSQGNLVTVAGGGSGTTDGIAATNAMLATPNSLAFDASGNLYIADDGTYYEGRVCKVNTQGIITTAADNYSVKGLATDPAGNVYLAGNNTYLVWKLATNGTVTIVAGKGINGGAGDGGSATNAELGGTLSVAVDRSGNLFIADSATNRVRKVNAQNIITTFAGVGHGGFWGDGAAATNASIGTLSAVAVDGRGNVYIGDQGNECVRQVSTNGIITTVAGLGVFRHGSDGVPATKARLTPVALACDALGNLFVGDSFATRIGEVPVVSGWPVLLVPSANSASAGTYTVAVTNASGGTKTNASLTVTQPTTAAGWLQAGNNALGAWDMDNAYPAFAQAVALSPTNADANAQACVTRFFLIPRQPAVSNYLATRLETPPGALYALNSVSDAEFSTNGALNLLDSVLSLVENLLAGSVVNTNASLATGDLIGLFNTNIMPSLLACDTNLARITNLSYTITFTTNETHMADPITFDQGDFHLLRALVQFFAFGSDTSQAFDFNLDINHVLALYRTNALTVQRFLSDYPNFLNATPNVRTEVVASKTALTNCMNFCVQGFDFLVTNRPAGANRLFNLPSSLTNYQTGIEFFNDVEASLTAPVGIDQFAKLFESLADTAGSSLSLPTNDLSISIYLGAYFNSTNSLRSYLPTFSGNSYLSNSLPDYTFNGLLQGVPAWQTESLLRGLFDFTAAGIYSTNLTDDYSGETSGWVLMYLSLAGQGAMIAFTTNGQVFSYATESYTNDPATFYQTFEITNANSSSVDWYFYTNDASGNWSDLDLTSGSSAGSFSGTLAGAGWENYDSIPTCGPVTGSFLELSGLYAGAWTNLTTGVRGPMKGILADDGTFGYALTTNGVTNSALVLDGGVGNFSAADSLVSTSTLGFQMANTLVPSGPAMHGALRLAGEQEVFSLVRTDFVPRDSLPTITSAPTNQNGVVGGRASFHVTAAGSPPLCYQWYSNSVAISGATTTALTLINLSAAALAATYSVEVHNVSGAAWATALLQPSSSGGEWLGITNSARGFLQFRLGTVPTNGTVVLEASTNLTTWLAIATNPATGTALDYKLPATNRPARFFRAKFLP
jgi:hypothetical protein